MLNIEFLRSGPGKHMLKQSEGGAWGKKGMVVTVSSVRNSCMVLFFSVL